MRVLLSVLVATSIVVAVQCAPRYYKYNDEKADAAPRYYKYNDEKADAAPRYYKYYDEKADADVKDAPDAPEAPAKEIPASDAQKKAD